MGTGSGAIAVSLAFILKTRLFMLVIFSENAIEVAKQNALNNNVSIETFVGDLLEPVKNQAKFHVITANLPYISKEEYFKLDKQVIQFEPKLALLAEKMD